MTLTKDITDKKVSSTNDGSKPDVDLGATYWPDISLLGVALIWGINIPIMKNALDEVNVYVFNAVRLVVSAAALVFFALLERKGKFPKLNWRIGRKIIVYSATVSAAYQLCFLTGISGTTSGNTALIIATVPMWTALLARIFINEEIRRLAWIGLVLALCGTIIVALRNDDISVGRKHLLGNGMVLLAALLWASGTVYSRPLLKQISPLRLSAMASVIALPVHLIVGVAHFEPGNSTALGAAWIWLIILYSGVLSSGLSQPMWNFGVRHAGAAHAAVVQNLIPVVAIIAAWLTRGEAATTAQIGGGALILGGLILMRWGR